MGWISIPEVSTFYSPITTTNLLRLRFVAPRKRLEFLTTYAVTQAHYNNVQWVNYFLHTGHLHIAGLKMSKSLKNFITIDVRLDIWTSDRPHCVSQELMHTWSARQIRLSFLGQLWNSRLDWNESLQAEAKAREITFDVGDSNWSEAKLNRFVAELLCANQSTRRRMGCIPHTGKWLNTAYQR